MQADADHILKSAETAYRAGSLQQAEEGANRLLAAEPKNLAAIVLLGAIYAKTGRAAASVQTMRKALAIDPASFEAHYWLGVLVRASGNLVEGARHAERAAKLRPDDAQAQFSLGLSCLSANDASAAIAPLQRATLLEPGVALPFQTLGDALKAAGRDDDAVQAYRRAVSIKPCMPGAFVSLAELLIAQGHPIEASDTIRRLFETTAPQPKDWLILAHRLIDAGMLEEGIRALDRAIDLDSDSAAAYALRGRAYRQLGRFDRAVSDLEASIALQPIHSAAFLDLVSCRRATPEDRPLIERLKVLLRDRNLASEDKKNFHYALGKAYDDLGEFGHAMSQFDEGNGIMAIQAASKSFDSRSFAKNADRLIGTVDRAYIGRNKAFGNPSELPVLIVGMIRSGTTLVEQIVTSHPEAAAGGELLYLMKRWGRLMQADTGQIQRSEAAKVQRGYLELLRSHSPTAIRVTDKLPLNFSFLGVIHVLFPNARIIHCRRDPVDTCISIYTTYFQEPVNFAHDKARIVFFYKEYLRLMEHWRRVLPADRFLEVDYEDLVRDRERVTRQMVEFCGLDWDDACLHHERNDGAIRTPSWWQARQPVYSSSIGRWRNYEPWLGEFRALLKNQGAGSV